jgi:hypothetical protein
MEPVKVYSPIEDKKIRETLNDSPIWKGLRYHISEVEIAKKNHPILFEYSFKFEGLKMVQFTGVKKLEK